MPQKNAPGRAARLRGALFAAVFVLLAAALQLRADQPPGRTEPASLRAGHELAPLRIEGPEEREGAAFGRFSERTVVIALDVDRDQARVVSYTLKDRPFIGPLTLASPTASREGGLAQFEVVLKGPAESRFTERLSVPGICLDHPPGTPPHIVGDTIQLHHDTILVEVPEVAGFDKIEAAAYTEGTQGPVRRVLADEPLEAAQFTAAGGTARYEDLAFATASLARAPAPDSTSLPIAQTTGDVLWPESFGDPDIYTVFGNAAEAARRINITIVPDGYTHAEKATMLTHVNSLIAYLRGITPYKEHDAFINYILVYAYSVESGPDQCDCDIVRNTAMSTGFPDAGAPCGDQGNRCLYYGYTCDTNTSGNIAAAEMRAPASDAKMVMVNTTRYGGCGGQRAVYSAGHPSAPDIEAHELGHALAGLADEYVEFSGCGVTAGGVNTSLNGVNGNWPEWISTIGPPLQGAQLYPQCIYRPEANCKMRSLGVDLCTVCRQQWALTFFGHNRIIGSAPVDTVSPASPLVFPPGTHKDFAITTRLASGAAVTNSITWRLQGPGFPTPTTVATNINTYSRTFTDVGHYTLTCEVIADTNFVKPAKYGSNRDLITWSVDAVVDADNDGYLSNVDCNDSNPAIHPGVPEVCNGVDDNCNNVTDEGFDLDGDGVTTCGGDCNDALATVRPGGAQICDGLNNDCNAPGWPSLAGTTETDDDGDGLSECQGDCNDAFASVRPGAPQICDGMNNNCSAPGWPSTAGTNDGDDDGDGQSECQGDCDDALASRFGNAAELNDGLDNQCPGNPGYALVDEVSGNTGFNNPADPTQLCWPAQSGAAQYEVMRSSTPGFTSGCAQALSSSNCWNDAAVPPVGKVFEYLVRPTIPHVGSWGASSSGTERTGLCGAETLCSDGLDNDGDGLADCADPDCLGQAICAPSVFSFVDTETGDDVPDQAIYDFLSSTHAGSGDFIYYAIHSPGPGDIAICSERADFYQNNYLALAVNGGSVSSGTWKRWYANGTGPWVGPVTSPGTNLFGPACAYPYDFCPEQGLDGRSPAILPSIISLCEVADVVYGCGDGTWSFTLKVGKSRSATCGF